MMIDRWKFVEVYMERQQKIEELVQYLTAIWKPVEHLIDSSKPKDFYLLYGLVLKNEKEWVKLCITENGRGGILCIKLEKQTFKVGFRERDTGNIVYRNKDIGRIFWDDREHEAGFPALRTDSWAFMSRENKSKWDDFVEEWLPDFKRNVFLSGCDVEATAHEHFVWNDWFRDNVDESVATLSALYGHIALMEARAIRGANGQVQTV